MNCNMYICGTDDFKSFDRRTYPECEIGPIYPLSNICHESMNDKLLKFSTELNGVERKSLKLLSKQYQIISVESDDPIYETRQSSQVKMMIRRPNTKIRYTDGRDTFYWDISNIYNY